MEASSSCVRKMSHALLGIKPIQKSVVIIAMSLVLFNSLHCVVDCVFCDFVEFCDLIS